MISSVDGLTPMQLRFAEEYTIDLNGAQAAIGAEYKTMRSLPRKTFPAAVTAALRRLFRKSWSNQGKQSVIAFQAPDQQDRQLSSSPFEI